jgi:DNA-binding response OmpR family regulator
MRMLLIEDDRDTAECIKEEAEKYYVLDIAYSGSDGAYLSQTNDYDVMVVDEGLPDINGIEVCRMARAAQISTPILILTNSNEITHKVSSLDSGADDCLTKPFAGPELFARLRALLRRYPNTWQSNLLCLDDLYLDLSSKSAVRAGIDIKLRRKEFDLLEYLIRHKNRVVSKEMILEHVWDLGIEVASNTVEVHIRSLRQKIDKPFEKKLIKTVHNFGYKVVE